ncbi:P-loop containing nucleoside triphosphate hydrolase protein [Phlyctochytrium arcticum]|nr:P-loop containing nucleoside triphosphate hydrolase protein [Phlyctochytrium arcticum]
MGVAAPKPSTENVIVVLRCRPFSEKERVAGHKKSVIIDPKAASITLTSPKSESDIKTFTFDAAFDEDCKQVDVYDATARAIVDAVLGGFNGTVFCYGQTGTGKTYSMQGVSEVPELRGIIPQAFHHIFDHISHRSAEKTFLVRVSFLEIYNEEIKDLLIVKPAKGKKVSGLDLKEHPETGVYVRDLSSHVVKCVPEMETLMTVGNKNRSVGATLMNENSSRSHSIFTITVESSEPGADGKDHIVAGKLHLVDLAGSEKLSKTGATGDRLKEATKINLSLSALGNCISALVDGSSTHIPYRDSKLTRLLQDSLGGNAKTLMIATLSPASYNYDETLSTLRYANRAKSIKNKPKINEDPKDAMLRQYQEEIEKLKLALQARQQGGKAGGATIHRLQEQVEAEKSALLASKDMLTSEKNRIAAELEKRAAELEAEKTMREQLALKLKSLETQLVVGGGDIGGFLEKVEHQERQLEETATKLAQQLQRERVLQEQLEARQEVQLQMEEHYASLQEEVDIKTKKLGKLFAKLQAAKSEISDLEDEFRAEREDFIDTIRELSRELSLKTAVIENFVPVDERVKIERRAVYDDESDEWVLEAVRERNLDRRMPRPCTLKSGTLKRPMCRYARMMISMGEESLRYRHDNIITIPLDMPERTTSNITPKSQRSASQTLKGALDYVMSVEDGEEIMVADLEVPDYGARPRTSASPTKRKNESPRRSGRANK